MEKEKIKKTRQIVYLLRRLLPYRRRLFLFVYSTLGTALFTGLPMLLVHQFFGIILKMNQFDTLVSLSLLMFAVYLLMGYFSARREVATRYLGERVKTDIVNDTAAVLLSRPLSYFGGMRTGEIISRVMTDAQSAGMAALAVMRLVREPFTIAAVVGAVVYLNWKLALVGFVGFPLAIFPIVLLGRRIRRASHRARELTADLSDSMVQGFSGIKVVKSYSLEETACLEIQATNNAIFDQTMKVARASAFGRPVVELVNGIGMVLVILIGGGMVMAGALDAEGLFTFVVALVALHKPTRTLILSYNELRFLLPGLVRLRELMEAEEAERDGELDAPELKEGISFQDVSFRYDRENVLEDVTLRIPAGSFVALVGPTGSGKTTLLDLIMRFYRPFRGRVFYDDIPLEDLKHGSLLARLSYAPQSPVLFNSPIRENVRMGRPEATDEEVRQACRLAGIHEEILSFTQGYDTPAGEAGGALSGGQRQRVALARAVLRRADVYLFDEPASALDAANEAALYQRLLEYLEGRTLILVTHRLAVLKKADLIVVVSGGRIEAAGRHAELIESSPTYRMLHKSGASDESGNKNGNQSGGNEGGNNAGEESGDETA